MKKDFLDRKNGFIFQFAITRTIFCRLVSLWHEGQNRHSLVIFSVFFFLRSRLFAATYAEIIFMQNQLFASSETSDQHQQKAQKVPAIDCYGCRTFELLLFSSRAHSKIWKKCKDPMKIRNLFLKNIEFSVLGNQ